MHEPYLSLTRAAHEAVLALEDARARGVAPEGLQERLVAARGAIERLAAAAALDSRQGYRFLWQRTLEELERRSRSARAPDGPRRLPSEARSNALSDAS